MSVKESELCIITDVSFEIKFLIKPLKDKNAVYLTVTMAASMQILNIFLAIQLNSF